MRYLSVCSGIEAVSVAWRPLGWRPAMFAEIDPFCCWLLHARYGASRPIHMPSPHDAPDRKEAKRRAAAIRNIVALPTDGDVINAGDFTKIGKSDVGTIDLLAGGTPCQSFSVAGKRAGLDDPRGNLTIEFARLADRLRPLWVVWENVPGILSIDGGRTFGAFLGLLVQLGYGVAYRILDAQFFGVPQRRRRVFVVGHLGDWRRAAAVLLEQSCLSGHPPPRRETRQNAPTIPARSAAGGGLGTDFDLDGGLIAGTMRSNNGGGGWSNSADHAAAGYIIPASGTHGISPCLNAGGMGRQDYESETLLAHTLLGKANDSHDFEKQTYITHALPADGFDASEDGTGRGVPMVPVAFNLRGREGGAVPEMSKSASLRAASGGSSNSYIAFSAKDYGADAEEIAPTLRGMGHSGSHANGGGQIAIAFSTNQRSEARERAVHGSLSSSRGGGNQIDGIRQSRIGESPVPAAFTLHGSDGTASAGFSATGNFNPTTLPDWISSSNGGRTRPLGSEAQGLPS